MTTTNRYTTSLALGFVAIGASVGVLLHALTLQLHRIGFAPFASVTELRLLLGLLIMTLVGSVTAFADHEQPFPRPGAER